MFTRPLLTAALSALALALCVSGGLSAQEVHEGLVYEVVNGNSITITKYTGSAASVVIPASIDGLPVTIIGERAFVNCESLTSVILSRHTRVGRDAFPGGARIKYRD